MANEKPQNNRVRVGGLWLKQNDYGKFYSGKITKAEFDKLEVDKDGNITILIYAAKEKKTENSPGYNVFGFAANGAAPAPKKAPAKPKVDDSPQEPEGSDLF